VWSEGENYDLALSFQERTGCDEIWAKICQVQGKDPSVEITQDIVEEEDERFDEASEMSSLLFELPPCEIERLDEINEIIATCLPFQIKREKLAALLERENYIKKMLDLFHVCEDMKNLKALHKLYEIFKNIFMLNKSPLLEVMLGDEALLFDVIGVFEYDPSQPQPRKHRDFLRSESRFKQVIPFGNSELVHKIHQTYRVQYIQDVVLPTPSVLEDNMISNLNSFIFFNKVEIVSIIQEDDKFLRELFSMITDESTDDEKRRDLVLFLKEFCIFSQNLQPQNREAFFKALSSLGILPTLEVTLAMDDMVIKTSSVDILTYLVEFSASMVREYALQQASQTDEEQFIVNIIIEQMICDPDPDLAMAVQLSSTLRLLLDPDNMMATGAISKSEKTEFLNYFYKHCMHVLISRLLACGVDEANGGRQTAQQAQLCSLILELLSFCVEHHTYQIRSYIVQNDLLRKALQLVKTKHTFLVLSVLRFMRRIIGLKDENYYRYIIAENLFEPIIQVFQSNNGRYNLLDSAVIEMFEFIRTEEIKTLVVHIIDKFGKYLEKVDYVRTFKELRRQYEQHQDRIMDRGPLDRYGFFTSMF
jgi:protein phosphatase-4 regulatory subunit 3